MDFKYIKKEALKRAKDNDICEEWAERMNHTVNVDELLDMYIEGIDFSFSTEFLSNDFFRRNLKGHMEHKGIFLDDNPILENVKKIVCLGDSRLNLIGNQYLVSEVFLRDKTKAKIVAKDSAFIMVDIFDDVDLEVIANDSSKVCVNVYKGAKVSFKQLDDSYVKIVKKKTKTFK
jgi:hypothetical protein